MSPWPSSSSRPGVGAVTAGGRAGQRTTPPGATIAAWRSPPGGPTRPASGPACRPVLTCQSLRLSLFRHREGLGGGAILYQILASVQSIAIRPVARRADLGHADVLFPQGCQPVVDRPVAAPGGPVGGHAGDHGRPPSLSIFQVVMISSTVPGLAEPVVGSPADGQVAHVLGLPAAWPRLEP